MHNFYTSLGRNFIPEEFLKSHLVEPFAGSVRAWLHQHVFQQDALSQTTAILVAVITGITKKDIQITSLERNILQEIITNLFLILLSSA